MKRNLQQRALAECDVWEEDSAQKTKVGMNGAVCWKSIAADAKKAKEIVDCLPLLTNPVKQEENGAETSWTDEADSIH